MSCRRHVLPLLPLPHVALAPNQSHPPRLQVLELVSMLQTSSGRAALVDMYGAKHECAGDAEMANEDDDVDANCCVPPAGTKVSLCKLAAHTVMNEQCGTIVGYSAETDRYVVQLEDATRVRVCRGNLRLEALTTHDFAHTPSARPALRSHVSLLATGHP